MKGSASMAEHSRQSGKSFETVVNVWEISQAEKSCSSPVQARISAVANQIVAKSCRLLNVAKYSDYQSLVERREILRLKSI